MLIAELNAREIDVHPSWRVDILQLRQIFDLNKKRAEMEEEHVQVQVPSVASVCNINDISQPQNKNHDTINYKSGCYWEHFICARIADPRSNNKTWSERKNKIKRKVGLT